MQYETIEGPQGYVLMGNGNFEIKSRYRHHLDAGIDLAFAEADTAHANRGRLQTWALSEDYSSASFSFVGGRVPIAMLAPWQLLPFEMDAQAAKNFIWDWLRSSAQFVHAPDTDGSYHHGFRIASGGFNWEASKNIPESSRLPNGGSLIVKTAWIVYSK